MPEPALPRPDEATAPSDTWLASHVHTLLDQAARSRAGTGGFGWLGASGSIEPERGRPLWITARMTHLFSMGHLLGRPSDGPLADHGVEAFTRHFRDAEHGGWYGALDDDLVPPGTAKTAYEHAFVLLAASSATLARRPGAEGLLAQACDVVTRHFWDEDAGAMVEEWDRSWSTLSDYRGSNANMHSVEAFLAAADATGEATWRHRALRIAGRIIDGEARSRDWRIPEHHDQAWQVLPDYNRDRPADQFRPYGATPGHGLEWSRLLLHLAAALGKDAPDWLVPASRSLFARAVGDAWDGARGGLAYTTDWDGTPVVSARLYWVVAEGIGAAAALHAATGERSYAAWYAAFWDYARRVFIDPTGFGWIQEVDPDGTPVDGIWSGRPDFYHAAQAALIPRLPLAPSMTAALAAGVRPAGG